MQKIGAHFILLILIFIIIGIVYAKTPRAYFCSYDDFGEIHRAAFEDTREPTRVFTTSHFNSYKYRPLNRAINLLTYSFSDRSAILFQMRNLLFHLLCVVLVYALSLRLFHSIPISVVSAAFFGLHPLANQSVIGAVMTNTAAHAAFLLALLMFMDSMKFSKHWKLLLIGSVVSAWISLMTYDSDIVIFALMCAWLSLNWRDVRESGIAVSFTAHFITSSAFCLGIYFTLRWLYVPSDWGRQLASISPTMGTATINLLMYLGALLLPVDTVLANKLVGTPLPPDIVGHKLFVVIVGGLSLFALVVIGFLAWPRLKSFGRFFNWKVVLFLVSGILAPLLPVLLFASHPSETYLYLSVAFYCMFLSYGLMKWLETRKSETKANVIYVTTVVVLIVLFSGASWFRNKRVFECGETARRILYGLPHELSRLNRLKLLFAEVPGEPTSRKYGEYGFRGLDTIGDGEKANRAITLALQAAYRNESLVGEVVKEQELLQRCKAVSETQLCVLVHWDGQIDLLASASSG